jgi:hypothetical protein
MINNLIKLPGGAGDNTPTDQIDTNQLSIGIQVEMEHTNDLGVAQEIAMDHLTEDPEYYSKLVAAGLASEFKPSTGSGVGDVNQSINDKSRVGNKGLQKGNMGGIIGGTSNGEVDGRNSEPIINKTIDIELEGQTFNSLEEAMLDEKKRRKKGKGKRKPKPTNRALWARAKSAARSKFDVYPSAYANGWAAKWYKSKGGGWRMSEAYPAQAMESPFPEDGMMTGSGTGSGTNGSGYDFVGYAESKKTMNKQQLKEAIKRMIREIEQDDVSVDAEKESVTITLDRELAQKLHDLLMTQLTPPGEDVEQTPAGPEDANAVVPAEDDTESSAVNMSADQLPIKAGEESGESVDDVTSDESDSMDEAKKKWIQKAITKPGALKKQMGVAAGKKIASSKLSDAAKKSGKLGQRARLARTLRKLKESLR